MMIARQARALARSVDLPQLRDDDSRTATDPLDVLVQLQELDREIHAIYLAHGARVQREHHSWNEIARALGDKSAQVVQQRFAGH